MSFGEFPRYLNVFSEQMIQPVVRNVEVRFAQLDMELTRGGRKEPRSATVIPTNDRIFIRTLTSYLANLLLY
jgi:hypothetical protein